MTSNKKTYTQPKLATYGAVETLTQGFGKGNSLDKDFPIETPKGSLTFS
jgi:hypothetical protein